MATLPEKLPLPDADDEDRLFVARERAQPASASELRELLRLHGERFRPILVALRDQPWKELVSTRDLIDALSAQGLDLSERTLRLYLAEMTEVGLIERHGRRGYSLAAAGAEVARELTIARRLGSILYHMEETMCQITFDLAKSAGLVSINAYVVPRQMLLPLCAELEAVFRAGLAVGGRVLFATSGEDILGRHVPKDCIGLGTMCSLTVAGMFMQRGIPSHAMFGGLLQIENGKPEHFLEMIRYDATTISPNEAFIRANLTSVSAAARGGRGAITASFREVPMSALPRLRDIVKECEDARFPGILLVGKPGQPVLNIPVHEGRVGVVLATGLNPLASFWEHAIFTRFALDPEAPFRLDISRPMVGPVPYEQLIPYQEFRTRVAGLSAAAAS
jgi:repressor of nif and glnA expression